MINRREMLLASCSAAAVGTSFLSINTNFSLIDQRLHNKITINELANREYAFTLSRCIVLSKIDNILYFTSQATNCWNNALCDTEFGKTFVGKYNNNFYIKHDVIDPCVWYMPALLAYHKAYPLLNKENGFFVVPTNWAVCAKHPLVKRNIQELKIAFEQIKKLKNDHDIDGCLNWKTIEEAI